MGRTVLIVDDHSGFRASARELLEAEGFEVVGEAEDAASAVEAARRLRPDIVLLDIQLPDADGVQVSREIGTENGQPRDRAGLEPRRLLPGRRARGVPGVRLHLQVAAERRGAAGS